MGPAYHKGSKFDVLSQNDLKSLVRLEALRRVTYWRGPQCPHQPLHDKINPKDCQVWKPLVIRGFSNFFGLFQVIIANPGWGTSVFFLVIEVF